MKWTDVLKLQGKNVTVVGDLIIDQNFRGRANKLSPEGPYPIFSLGEGGMRSTEPGGAGSAAIRAAALGASIKLVAPVGKEALRHCNLTGWQDLILCEGWENPIKTRFLTDWGPEIMRMDEERWAPDGMSALTAGQLAKIPNAAALLISDYGKGAIGPEVMSVARRKFNNIVVDGKRPWRSYAGAKVITPNDAEVEKEMGDPVTLSAIAERLLKHKIEYCLWTRGTHGAFLISCHGPTIKIPADNISAKPAVGAGDSVAATLAVGLAAGFDMEDAARLAIQAASCSVELGHPATLGELLRWTEDIWTRDGWNWERTIEAWRVMGDYIVCINGVFDLLHAGHIDLVKQALHEGKQRCGGRRVRLFVAVNDDTSTRGYKNPPIEDAKTRGGKIASLRGVDEVCHFQYSTPVRVLQILKPDLYVRGADHAPREHDFCAQAVIDGGGESILTQRIGVSTTNLKQRIIEEWKRNESENQKTGGNIGS